MVDRLLASLTVLTLAFSAASLLVIALREPCRRLAGSAFVYWLWLLVPLALIAALSPALPHSAAPAASLVVQDLGQPHSALGVVLQPQAPSLIDAALQLAKALAPYLIGAWGFGLLAFLCRIALMQRRFMDGLGRLTRDPGRANVFYSEKTGVSPSVIGMLRSRIVLPADFGHLYASDEQTLIMAHERTHVRERHPTAGALGVLIVAAQWFNPLAYVALSLFRIDQELACDAAVVTAHPTSRGAYARAMLKARFAGAANPPLAYCWISRLSLPMKDRIGLLKATPPTAGRRAVAMVLLTLLASGSAVGTYAMAPHAEISLNPSSALTDAKPTPVAFNEEASGKADVRARAAPAAVKVLASTRIPSSTGATPVNLVTGGLTNIPSSPPKDSGFDLSTAEGRSRQQLFDALAEAAAQGANVAAPRIITLAENGAPVQRVLIRRPTLDASDLSDTDRVIESVDQAAATREAFQ